ncbi:MAG: hypothetical protein U1A27_03715 [Phycisphaerae bacterium]
MTQSTETTGLSTSYSYDLTSGGGQRVTRTLPGSDSPTEITAYYRDGQMRSVSGTAVVGRYYYYAPQTLSVEDGPLAVRMSEVRLAASDSPRVETTYLDALGRPRMVERFGFGTGNLVQTIYEYYDSSGSSAGLHKLHVKRTNALVPNDSKTDPYTINAEGPCTVYTYDDFGDPYRQGADVNRDKALTVSSSGTDRITETVSSVVQLSSQWYRQTLTNVYRPGTTTATTISTVREQLTGLASGVQRSIDSIDANGNATHATTTVDRSNKLVTDETTVPGSATHALVKRRNGLVIYDRTSTGRETTFGYDALARRTSTTDASLTPTRTTQVHYDSTTGQVTDTVDGAGNSTLYSYDDSGRLSVVQGPAISSQRPATRYAYNSRGEVTRVWGDSPQPVSMEYNDYGQRYSLTTFRTDSVDWTASSWPGGSAAGDTTTWEYDDTTGLLTTKRYADDSQVTYSYSPGGALTQRTWARLDASNNELTTTYTYDQDTGDRTGVDYSDDTPDLAFTYDRLGRLATVTSSTQGHTFNYRSSDLQFDYDQIDVLDAPAGYKKYVQRRYESSSTGIPGRPNGAAVGPMVDDGQPHPGGGEFLIPGTAEYESDWAYDSVGRVLQVVGPGLPPTTQPGTGAADYEYESGGDRVTMVKYENVTGTILAKSTRRYETTRDLLSFVENKWGTATRSKYAYVNDARGRRTSVVYTGTAFDASHFVMGLQQPQRAGRVRPLPWLERQLDHAARPHPRPRLRLRPDRKPNVGHGRHRLGHQLHRQRAEPVHLDQPAQRVVQLRRRRQPGGRRLAPLRVGRREPAEGRAARDDAAERR